MLDLLFLAVIAVLFLLAIGYLTACGSLANRGEKQ